MRFESRQKSAFQSISRIAILAIAGLANPGGALAETSLHAPLSDEDFLFDGTPNPAQADLGRFLFFDPVLSGNRNIACATCHDGSHGTSDGLALGLGEGAVGLGLARKARDEIQSRVPRNAPALWNIGARANTVLFHDGRVERVGADTRLANLRNPAGSDLPPGIYTPLAVQALFPPLSPVEMAGQAGENPVATASHLGNMPLAWDILTDRLRAIPEYQRLFAEAYDTVRAPSDIRISHVANALAAFQTVAFRATNSPFDLALATGSIDHFSAQEKRGFALFYGDANCSSCHMGPLLTDHGFHAIAMPQIGPGKGGEETVDPTGYASPLEDLGRYAVTLDPNDKFKFRTPSLRNVTMTAPYGHAGTYATLEGVVRHHLDPIGSLEAYLAQLPQGPATEPSHYKLATAPGHNADPIEVGAQASQELRLRIAQANELEPIPLSDQDVSDIVAFLGTLTDPASADIRDIAPKRLPSGLDPTGGDFTRFGSTVFEGR